MADGTLQLAMMKRGFVSHDSVQPGGCGCYESALSPNAVNQPNSSADLHAGIALGPSGAVKSITELPRTFNGTLVWSRDMVGTILGQAPIATGPWLVHPDFELPCRLLQFGLFWMKTTLHRRLAEIRNVVVLQAFKRHSRLKSQESRHKRCGMMK